MIKEEYKYSDITEKIIGCAMKVHNTLGNGFQEVIYQRALAIELEKTKLLFTRELEMPIYYENIEIGTRRVDFLIEDKIILELKAVTSLDKVHLAQALNYLEAFKLEIGLLINFGNTRLEFKRLIKTLKNNINDIN
ncbi:MAG: GxxExxY protein [Cyclobacteriaceae bacterium]